MKESLINIPAMGDSIKETNQFTCGQKVWRTFIL